MSKKSAFNKEQALDDLMKILDNPLGTPISKIMKSLEQAQDFIQTNHDNALREGFEAGCNASSKTNEL